MPMVFTWAFGDNKIKTLICGKCSQVHRSGLNSEPLNSEPVNGYDMGEMKLIDAFSFGSLVIDGKKYSSDLIIYPDGRIVDGWWRKSGHRLFAEDIHDLIHSQPETIIAGTGIYGAVKPDKGLETLLHEKEIVFIAEKNESAIQKYNQTIVNKRVGACFHLTC